MPGRGSGRKTNLDLAYAAGFIDADGFIAINRYCPRKKSIREWEYNLRIGAVNTHKDILNWFELKFGGFVCARKVADPLKHNISYAWYVDSKHAEEVLKAICPYLKRKRLQAEIALEYRETYSRAKLKYIHKSGKFVNTIVLSDILEKRKELRKQMKTANSRGITPCPVKEQVNIEKSIQKL